jgi:hypothetical protein
MGSTLKIGSDFEIAKVEVIGAMLYPRDERLRAAYTTRNAWSRRIGSDLNTTASAVEVQTLLDLPSRRELSDAADKGVKTGTVAGDLLALIYEQWRMGAPEPSMRDALERYPKWSIGKKYGDGEPLKYSDMQLRRFFEASCPSAHLWAAHRLLQRITDDGESYRTAFDPEGLPILLGVARSVQDFAGSFTPKRTKPAKPIVDGANLHRVPDHIEAIELELRPL